MFYTTDKNIWRWKMSVARVMGNTLDDRHISTLVKAFHNNDDERVRGMIAWALGRIGGPKAEKALNSFLPQSKGSIRDEIESDVLVVDAIVDRIRLLNPPQREVIELIMDKIIAGEEILFVDSEK